MLPELARVTADYPDASLEGSEEGELIFLCNGKVVRVAIERLLEIAETEDPAHRHKQLSLLWERAYRD